jgi:hypothetical protein
MSEEEVLPLASARLHLEATGEGAKESFLLETRRGQWEEAGEGRLFNSMELTSSLLVAGEEGVRFVVERRRAMEGEGGEV